MENNFITEMSQFIDLMISGEMVEFKVVPNKDEYWIPVRIVGVNVKDETVSHANEAGNRQFVGAYKWRLNENHPLYYQYRFPPKQTFEIDASGLCPIVLSLTDGKCKEFDPPLLQQHLAERGDAVKTFDWILRCAESSIKDSYSEGAPRRIQMEALCAHLRGQLKAQMPDMYDENGGVIR